MAIVSSQSQPSQPDDKPPKRKKAETAMASSSGTVTQESIPPKASTPELSPTPIPATPSIVSPEAAPEEKRNQNDEKLRPQKLSEYIGQRELKDVLKITIQAAQSRQEPLDHLLLYGPPGLGKTTISLILATEMGVTCKVTSAPALERPRDIVGLLMNLQKGDILFIDEIHRLSRMTEELLYPAMEDYRLDITIGKGQSARIRSLTLPPFTLIGATTRVGALTSPLRDRFGFIQRLRFYEPDELDQIILRTATILGVEILPDAAQEVAQRSRGTPRIANRLLRRVRDYAAVKQVSPITGAIAIEALELFNVDPCGLDWTDRRLLSVMIEHYGGGPVGLDTLAAATGEDAQTIEEVYEPYLLQIGYLNRTPRGRVATQAAWKHLGFDPPEHQLSILR
jgi:holliday junction DNA helicase RuvB